MKRLDLSGLQLSDQLLAKILTGNGPTLTSLALRECAKLTDEVRHLHSVPSGYHGCSLPD